LEVKDARRTAYPVFNHLPEKELLQLSEQQDNMTPAVATNASSVPWRHKTELGHYNREVHRLRD